MENNILNTDQVSNKGKTYKFAYWVVKISLIIIGVISLYYLIMRAFPFLIITKDIYGPYYFPRAVWIWPHVLGGIVVMVVGPFQFIPTIQTKYPRSHRMLGYIFLIGVLVSSLTLAFLITTSSSSLVIDVGLGIGGVVWLVTAVLAFIAIKNRKIEQHKEWMIRCYMVTLAFVLFRLVIDILSSLKVTNEPDIVSLASWISWTVPLFATEVVLQGRKILA
nr:DUF2306 domain-containing protein [uncultured Chryseobacterium sp.]